MTQIAGRDPGFELQKFRVVLTTGEVREQLGLAGVQIGDKVSFIEHATEPSDRQWIVLDKPAPLANGVLHCTVDLV